MVSQERTGQQHRLRQLQRFAAKQQLQVGGQLALLRLKHLLMPDGAWGAVVVVAGDDDDRHHHGTDQLERFQDSRGVGCRGIEQIPSHQHKGSLLRSHDSTDPADGRKPLLLQPKPLLRIRHGAIGLTDLPVSGVKEANQQQTSSAGKSGSDTRVTGSVIGGVRGGARGGVIGAASRTGGSHCVQGYWSDQQGLPHGRPMRTQRRA